MTKTKVYLRELGLSKNIEITSTNKPIINKNVQEKWQNILDATAEIIDIPAALIMRVTQNHMEVFLKSSNPDNPYDAAGKDTLGHGLYCETVIGEDRALHISNALKDHKWMDNPDIKMNMIAYYGMPIKWKDGEVFGTICILDNKENTFKDKHIRLIELYKEAIETDLYNSELIQHLTNVARIDSLTNIPNRLSVFERLEEEFNLYQRNAQPFCLVIIDLSEFKTINDRYGHEQGDAVLKAVARILKNRLRLSDTYGRIGGDEFMMLLRNTDKKGAENVIVNLKETFQDEPILKKYSVDFTYGIAEMSKAITSPKMLYKKADKDMIKIR